MNITFRLLVCLFVASAGIVSGQHVRTDYPFIKHQHNKISYSGDSSAFVKLFTKLDDIAAGSVRQLRIAHIGGSHVQAGLWSAAFVNALHTKYATSGGGYFVFPYRIGNTNEQPFAHSFSVGKWRLCRSVGKQFCLPLGMSALSVSTKDSVSHFGVELTDKAACRYVNEVLVYHNFSSSYHFDLCQRDTARIRRQDKIEEGFTRFVFDLPVDSVCFTLHRLDTSDAEFTLFGLSLENTTAPGFYLAGLGANGASTTSFLKSEKLVQQLASLQADLYILSLGVNDTQSGSYANDAFVGNYDTLITILRKATPDAAVLLTTTTDNFIRRRNSNRRTIGARDAMFQLMLKHDIGVWDLFSLMGGYRSMTTWYLNGLASRDKVHFNGRGYAVVGTLMFEAFEKAYEFNRTKQ